MGHTLVARFSAQDEQRLGALLKKAGGDTLNKIPYGRQCDRALADRVLPYHVTLFHWGKEKDAFYLGKLQGYRFPAPFPFTVLQPDVAPAEEGSCILRCKIQPSAEYRAVIQPLEQRMGRPAAKHLHLTLGISKEHSRLRQVCSELRKHQKFPFEMTVIGLDLYKIWTPTELAQKYR